jgi:hypothetical protein
VGRRRPAAERFWEKVTKTAGCWLWTGARTTAGYGLFNPTSRKPVYAHRYAFALIKGPVPGGKQLDHLCRNPGCVNPDHLEPVTNRENSLRGLNPNVIAHLEKRCRKGHALTPENTYVNGGNYRPGQARCKLCHKAYAAISYQRRKLKKGVQGA